MKRILIILLFPICAFSQKVPRVILEATSGPIAIQDKDTLIATGCDSNCEAISGYVFTKVSGPGNPVIMTTAATPNKAIVSGLQTGYYIFRITIKNASGLTATDTCGITAAVPIHDTIPRICPPVIVCPPVVVCPKVDTAAIQALKVCPICPAPIVCPPPIVCPVVDSVGIINAYLASHPCPVCPAPVVCPPVVVCPVCPPIPKQRTVVGITLDLVTNKKTVVYDDGTTSSL
jgi:hypothetical protein